MDLTLLKGLNMLEALARSDTHLGVTDLVNKLGLTKSNVHRTLATLVSAGYVDQDENGKYGCTLKLFELGGLITDRIDVRAIAEAPMEELGRASREAVHLAVLDGLDVIYLHKVESPEPIRAYSRVGGRAPAYSVASGKALLAYQSPAYLEKLNGKMEIYTPETLTTESLLHNELRAIRSNSVAINRGEWRAEVGGIAAIVFNHENLPIAAIGVSGPIERIEQNRDSNTATVKSTARKVSTSLGCNDYDALMLQWKDS